MSKKNTFKLLAICFLLFLYPLLWLFNQRINYRKFLTLDTKFDLISRPVKKSELSSPAYVLSYLNSKEISAALDPDVSMSDDFDAVSRTVKTEFGNIKVYEYEQSKDTIARYDEIKRDPLNKHNSSDIFIYKNLIIYNVSGNELLADLIKNIR